MLLCSFALPLPLLRSLSYSSTPSPTPFPPLPLLLLHSYSSTPSPTPSPTPSTPPPLLLLLTDDTQPEHPMSQSIYVITKACFVSLSSAVSSQASRSFHWTHMLQIMLHCTRWTYGCIVIFVVMVYSDTHNNTLYFFQKSHLIMFMSFITETIYSILCVSYHHM